MIWRRALFWVVCVALVLWSLPSAAAHLTSPSDTSAGFGGNVVNDDPCRWTDDGTEHDEAGTKGIPADCNVAPQTDDAHDGVSGTYTMLRGAGSAVRVNSAPGPNVFVGVGACADHPVDAAFGGGAKKGFGDVGCDASQFFPQNVPEPLFWDVDGDDCYNTVNQDANGMPFLTQQERKEDNKDCSDKKAQGLEATGLNLRLFGAGVGHGAATTQICDLEVAFSQGFSDETVIDDSDKKNTGQVPDGTWDDGGFAGACHTPAGYYANSGWNSPGCAGLGPVESDNTVAHAEDWVSGDSVWIGAACYYVGESGGSSRLVSTVVEALNHHGANPGDPVAGLANDSELVTEFAHDVDDRGAKCFYDDGGAGLLDGTTTTSALGEEFDTPDPNDGYDNGLGDAVPTGDTNPVVNCTLETLTGETGGIDCSHDGVADARNYGHGGGHSQYPNTDDDMRWTKGEFHLNHLLDADQSEHPDSSNTSRMPEGELTVFEEADGGVAYPDDPTACQSNFDHGPYAAVYVFDLAVFSDGVWAEAGDQVVNPGGGHVSLHPAGVISASGGWIDSTTNFGDSTDDHSHCDEDGHYDGGAVDQANGNEDDHADGSCEGAGGNDEGHAST